MIKFSILYPYEESKRFDMDYYCNSHIAMVKEKVGGALVNATVERGLGGPGGPAPFVAIAQLYFNSMEDFATYCAPLSPVFDADLPNFTDIQPCFQVSEVVL